MDTRKDKLAKVLNGMEMRKKANMPADEMLQALDELPQGVVTDEDMQRLIMQQNAIPLPPNRPIVRDESMPPNMLNADEVQRMIINKGQGAMPPDVINETQAQALLKQRKKQAAMPPIYKNMQ